jgi:hypothetical protein
MPLPVLKHLASARRIADHALRLGIQSVEATPRVSCEHLGAVLADAVLQAGVNYRTVVRVRIERILAQFPEAAKLGGLTTLVERGEAAHFLLWNHQAKIARFVSVVELLAGAGVETTDNLKRWLPDAEAKASMLALHGIGPKTFDYLCCLVGIDCIPVDRHIKTFAIEAGVVATDYDTLKLVMSFAADLLEVSRRDFDAWIWATVSARRAKATVGGSENEEVLYPSEPMPMSSAA